MLGDSSEDARAEFLIVVKGTDPTADEFAWSPDGGRVAFHSRHDGQWGIYVRKYRMKARRAADGFAHE